MEEEEEKEGDEEEEEEEEDRWGCIQSAEKGGDESGTPCTRMEQNVNVGARGGGRKPG